MISVEDSGIGIPLDKQETVFEVFAQSDETTTRVYGGSGLGLAISKKLAMQMGGDLTLESDGLTGTKFIFNLKPVIDNNSESIRDEEGYLMVERWLAADPLIRDIVLEYIPQVIDQVKELRALYDEKDFNELREGIHKLKGACECLQN